MRPMELAGEIARKVAVPAFAVTFAVGGVACSGSDESALRPDNGSAPSAQSAKEAANACAGEYDLTANLANQVFADRSSVFPSLADNKGNLLPKSDAIEAMQKQTGSDFRVAAVMSEVYNVRDNKLAPDTLTIPGFESAVSAMKVNNKGVAKRVEYMCNQFEFNQPEEEFAVVGGNATQISFARNEKGVAGIVFETIDVDRVISGFTLGANFDDAELSRDDRIFLKQFMKDTIVTEDGKIVIRNLALNGGVNVEDQVAETPVSPNLDQSDNKNGGGGTFGKKKNKGESDQPGSVEESGGDEGDKPGTAPSFGTGNGNGHGSTTSTSRPGSTTTTTIPNSTTTTSTTTRPPVVTTTTTITTPKGTVTPCEPNPPYTYCP